MTCLYLFEFIFSLIIFDYLVWIVYLYIFIAIFYSLYYNFGHILITLDRSAS